jgi:hypothetical protein
MDSLQEAFKAAQDRYPGNQWAYLPSKVQTEAIYNELRRIDAEYAASPFVSAASLTLSPLTD